MPITNYSPILKEARDRHFIVGAFNALNLEMVQAVTEAADETGSPLILQCYCSHLAFSGADFMRAMYEVAAKKAKTNIAMGLDHGFSYEQSKLCIDNHFTGVMIDMSSQDIEQNITETKRVVELAHSRGVSVEAELGVIFTADATPETIATGLTDPAVARRFVENTNVDCLAVSIGTAHGAYKYEPRIHYDLLETLIREVPCPIVVHGGSGVSDEDILHMAKLGVAKLNVGTDFFVAYNSALQNLLAQHGSSADILEVLQAAKKAVKEVALHKLALFNAYRI